MTCLFCEIVEKKRSANIIFENDDFLVFHDIFPAAPYHALIIPKEHLTSIDDAKAHHAVLLGKLLLIAQQIAQAEPLCKQGYRLVCNTREHGGQTVPHLHFHLLGGRHMTWPPG
ncbi:MAG: histidine triad nucleotide-binding protein [Legionellaceae bacterium]|nr:histidine triad nucleotide-binding protein [Legionellaceae bacterium]